MNETMHVWRENQRCSDDEDQTCIEGVEAGEEFPALPKADFFTTVFV
jgi:hypothetical protein